MWLKSTFDFTELNALINKRTTKNYKLEKFNVRERGRSKTSKNK